MEILIPAAGASSRMGGDDKLLRRIEGAPLLRRTVGRALATGAGVMVTLRAADPRREVIANLGVTIHEVAEAHRGMSASLRLGALGQGPLMILPADMPELTTEDLTAMIARHGLDPQSILRALAEDGTPGHPVIFPGDLRSDFARLFGDEGARAILKAHGPRVLGFALPGIHATVDLDTPEAWAEWEARTQRRG